MSTTSFFTKPSDRSRVKARIVANYFDAWANIIQGAARRRGVPIGYLDLFAGRGEYEDGAESTPLLVLRKALANPRYRDLVWAKFNEADPSHAAALRTAIGRLDGLDRLRHLPEVFSEVVDADLAARFEGKPLPPTLTFADPYGYKGLTRRLVAATIRSWGSEVILFFNFNRVNPALSHDNDSIVQHIDELFGPEDAAALRRQLSAVTTPWRRHQLVLDKFIESLKAAGGRYARHFAFGSHEANRTSHYLVHLSKDEKGYKVMTGVMARASSWATDGVPSFKCAPAPQRGLFDDVASPLDQLKELLQEDLAGQEVPVGELWSRHGIGRDFTPKNYKDAVRELLDEEKVVVECPVGQKWRKGTLPDGLIVHFPFRTA